MGKERMRAKEKIKFQISIASSTNGSRSEPALLTNTLVQNVFQAAQLGYQALEIHIQNPAMTDIKELNAACRKSKIKISGIATGLSYAKEGLNLIDDDNKIRKKAVERLKDFADLAAELDSTILIGRMKGDIDNLEKYDYYERVLADSLNSVAEYAAKSNVLLMLEAINRYESNYMNKTAQVADFIRQYNIPATKVLMDVFHMNIEEVSIADSLRKNFSDLGYFHIADSNRMYPGAGHVDFKPIFDVLLELGYQGFVSLECLREPDGETAAKEGIRFFENLVREYEN